MRRDKAREKVREEVCLHSGESRRTAPARAEAPNERTAAVGDTFESARRSASVRRRGSASLMWPEGRRELITSGTFLSVFIFLEA